VIFKQFRFEPLSQLSYLVGCTKTGESLVIDPIVDLGAEFYVLEAADRGASITGVVDTHVHADYISAADELAEMTGAVRYGHTVLTNVAGFEFTPLDDGEVIEVGNIRIEILHTPGHTPEHVSLLVTDRARSDEPWFVLTGDSLLVGDVGRPDLLIGDQSVDAGDEHARARDLFGSLQRLLSLPDHVEVWPGHYGGSACGGINMSGKTSSTVSYERRFNKALQQPDAASFEDFVLRTVGPAPTGHLDNKRVNLGLGEVRSLPVRP
jgi:glyoxylase-like metal-dependent hydrolase (beta-lactamase superfamily II)